MTQVCSICNHPNRIEINQEIIQGLKQSEIAKKYGVGPDSIAYHSRNHISKQPILPCKKKQPNPNKNSDSAGFTFRQQLFIKFMSAMPDCDGLGNASKAARMAGYKHKNAGVYACELLKKPKIRAAIEVNRMKLLRNLDITAERVLQELAALAFSNIKDLFDDSGNFKKLNELPRHVSAVLPFDYAQSSVDNSGNRTGPIKIKLPDKIRALELLGKYYNLWSDKVGYTGGDNQTSADERAMETRQRLFENLGAVDMDKEK